MKSTVHAILLDTGGGGSPTLKNPVNSPGISVNNKTPPNGEVEVNHLWNDSFSQNRDKNNTKSVYIIYFIFSISLFFLASFWFSSGLIEWSDGLTFLSAFILPCPCISV